ncbi:MAG: ABC transporter ATP-binding protein, partial [Phyllobacteriaceae bacterium]|nr:ABC transporter ATP-binding protein [Phyllobacteriaceae bacterium]
MSAQDEPLSQLQAQQARSHGRAGASFAGAIEFRAVGFSTARATILHDISLTFEAGRITCLLGPSGCGKTTVLRLAAGVARPTAGRILLEGREVAGPSTFVPPEQRNVGLMFQDYALFPHLTVLQNVVYGLYAVSTEDARKAALTALERVGLVDLADRFPNRLSGGEQQRVALARAIVPRPQVILMDEPFSGLDQRLRDHVRADTLAVVRETRSTAVLVTHDPMEAIEFADYIYLMRSGGIVQRGTPQELYSEPRDAAAAQFFASYNLFSGRVQGGQVATPLGPVAATGHADGSTVDVLVRPTAVALSPGHEGVEAYVLESRFLGEHQRLSLAFPGHETPVIATLDRSRLVSQGGAHRFVMDETGIHIFKKP